MARIRTIKPEFPQSETMGRVSRDARLLFIQLWTVAELSAVRVPYSEPRQFKYFCAVCWGRIRDRENARP